MSRPVKAGLDYFPLDVDFFSNKKIKALRRTYGATGIAVYLNILCRVYSSGYYYRFTSEEDLAADIAEDISNGQIRKVIVCVVDVIHHLVDNGIIDKSLYEQELVITGKAMQEQFAESASKAKRKIEIGIYSLIEKEKEVDVFQTAPKNTVSSEKTEVNSEETPVNSEEMQQSKVKKNKVNNTTTCSAPARTHARGKHKNVILSDEDYEAIIASGIPADYIDYFSERLVKGGYHYPNHAKTIREWWKRDSKTWELTRKQREQQADFKTFDPDEAFAAALERSKEK